MLGYDLVELRAEGRRKVFVFPRPPDPTPRRSGVLWRRRGRSADGVLYNHQGHEGATAQCLTNRPTQVPAGPVDRNTVRRWNAFFKSCSTGFVTVIFDVRFRASSAGETGAKLSSMR